MQDNMELGVSFSNTLATTLTAGAVNGNIVNMHFDFKPGFKVGLGGNFDYDNWDMGLEYTWFHNTNSQTASDPTGGNLLTMVGNPYRTTNNGLYDNIHSKWTLKMDIIDLNLGRWHYVGTQLTFRPGFGARADWIRQKLSTTETRNVTNTAGSVTADTGVVTQRTSSWALGPEFTLTQTGT